MGLAEARLPAGRRLLTAVAVVLAGCSGGVTPESDMHQEATGVISESLPSATGANPVAGASGEIAAPSPPRDMPTDPVSDANSQEPHVEMNELDLRFANVTAVALDQLAEGIYRFDVTLFHDDAGEAPDYADAWEVIDLEGNLLGRRVLLHAHSTAPFTRSETIEIPAGVAEVIVRGRDMRHGYGGQALRVDLATGGFVVVEAPTQGPRPGG